VLHGWGGGAERFVRDLAATDRERITWCARPRQFDRRRYGEVLELHDDTLTRPPLRRLHLSDPSPAPALFTATMRCSWRNHP